MALKIAPNFISGVWGPQCKGVLGMIFAPGRWKSYQPEIIRNIEEDMKVLKEQYNVQTLVSLIQQDQRPKYKLTQKRKICERLNIKHMSYPMPDFGIPADTEKFKQFVKKVVDDQIRKDKVVIAHCKAGLGRTGLFASSCLIYAGMATQNAIQLVRRTRPGTIQTQNQVQYVKSLKF